MNKTKKTYMFDDDGDKQTLLLTDDQAAVFVWLQDRGYNFSLTNIDVAAPEEINPEDWIK